MWTFPRLCHPPDFVLHWGFSNNHKGSIFNLCWGTKVCWRFGIVFSGQSHTDEENNGKKTQKNKDTSRTQNQGPKENPSEVFSYLAKFWHGIRSNELVPNESSEEAHGLWSCLTQFFFGQNHRSENLHLLRTKIKTQCSSCKKCESMHNSDGMWFVAENIHFWSRWTVWRACHLTSGTPGQSCRWLYFPTMQRELLRKPKEDTKLSRAQK